ncbi:hypothetical protein SUGI_1088090 [Cryptomeria japonica]|nr:hypothetical protein SUGI_1088090 [Cryptomeria japonica]
MVCKGYAQEEGEDYGETFAPVERFEGVRTLLAFVAYKGFKLHKALYGLKQASRAWYEIFHSHLVKIGFQRTSEGSNIYLKTKGDKILVSEVFVDDIIFGGNDDMCHDFANEMKSGFEMSLVCEINFFIGLQIQQMKEGIFITQSKYVKEVLKFFGTRDCKPVGTPMVTGCKLSKEDDSAPVDEKEYKSMIGKLHYAVHNRPNIAHAVGLVARFQKNLKESHMIATKRIFRYLKGTLDYGLWYPCAGDFDLNVYTNTDWAGNVDDKKSTIGGAFFLGGKLVSWSSKKHNCISQLITKDEYVAAYMNCTQAIWMKHILEGFKLKISEPGFGIEDQVAGSVMEASRRSGAEHFSDEKSGDKIKIAAAVHNTCEEGKSEEKSVVKEDERVKEAQRPDEILAFSRSVLKTDSLLE